MLRLVFASAIAAAVLASAPTGASSGKGLGGDLKDDAFHDGAAGPTYGFKLGAEIALVDLWLQHDQYYNDGGVNRTWTQLLAGVDRELDSGSAFLELGTGAGLADGRR